MPRPDYVTRDHWCRGYYQYPGLEVQVGDTQVLIPSHRTPGPIGFLSKLANGELVTGTSLGCEQHGEEWAACAAAVPSWRRSRDGGQTWRDTPAWPTYNGCQLPNGEILHLGRGELEATDEDGVYQTGLDHSADNGYTHTSGRALLVDVPELARGEGGFGRHKIEGVVDHAVVRLEDGSMLAALYGKFIADIKYRSFVVRSSDGGNTWRYLSTVAFDLTRGNQHRVESFCEPDLLVLPGGDILCFMRTGGTYNSTFSPLYMSRSNDGGKSWSQADPIADRGVWPNACLMANGVIAVTCGRTGDWLAFSLDEGHTWIGHFCFYRGPQAYDACNYDWVEEVMPDTLLVAYARTEVNDCGQSEILGTYMEVKRT